MNGALFFVRVLALIGLFFMTLFAAPQPVAANGDSQNVQSQRIEIHQGKSKFIDLDFTMSTVVIGNPEIADAVVLNPSRFYILGKQVGTTNIQLLDKSGQVVRVYELVIGLDGHEVAKAISDALPDANIRVYSVAGRFRLGGTVADQADRARAVDIAQSYTELPVIDTLQTIPPKQVFLTVRIVEATSTAGHEIGMNLTSLNLALNGTVTVTNAQVSGSPAAGTYDAKTTVDALVQRGLARYLATPTLTALSGETASFLAGGEIPLPTSPSDPDSIEYKEFGVRLSFTPTVRKNGLINLELQPEVSQIDVNSSYSSNGFTVPGFSTRRAHTTVELRDGESFVIAGLLQSTNTRGTSGVAALSELPVVGALFRKSQLSDSETELLIIVTPSLTQPIPRGQRIKTPLDGARASSGLEQVVDGKLERSTYDLRNALKGDGIDGRFGPILNAGGQGALVPK